MKLNIVLFQFSLFFLIFFSISFAQLNNLETVDDFFIVSSDKIPSPGDVVEIDLIIIGPRGSQVGGVDWIINGVVREEFRDEHNISLLVGQLGTSYSIYARILLESEESGVVGVFNTNSIDILPIIFDLLWEADSVVPAGYRGLPLPGPYTPIRVSAYIRYVDKNGVLRNENDFFFDWEQNSKPVSRRGVGENTIILEGFNYVESPITVSSLISFGTEIDDVRKIISINLEIPKILLYKFDNLTGLNNITIRETDVFLDDITTISLYPLFIGNNEFNNGMLNYTWSVNKKEISNVNRKVDINSNSGLDRAEIDVTVENSEYSKYSQRANHSFLIGF